MPEMPAMMMNRITESGNRPIANRWIALSPTNEPCAHATRSDETRDQSTAVVRESRCTRRAYKERDDTDEHDPERVRQLALADDSKSLALETTTEVASVSNAKTAVACRCTYSENGVRDEEPGSTETGE